jgi:hypothetical protein
MFLLLDTTESRPFEEQRQIRQGRDGKIAALETNDDAWMNGLTRFAGKGMAC